MTDFTQELVQAIIERLSTGSDPGRLRGKENYRFWSIWVKELLVLQGLWSHVDPKEEGTVASPESGGTRAESVRGSRASGEEVNGGTRQFEVANAPAGLVIPTSIPPDQVRQYIRDDAKVLTTIRRFLSPGPLNVLRSSSGQTTQTARQAWQTLHALYKPTFVDLIRVMRQIGEYSTGRVCDPNCPFATDVQPLIYLLYTHRYIREEIGDPLDDDAFIYHVLSSLPPSWDRFAEDMLTQYERQAKCGLNATGDTSAQASSQRVQEKLGVPAIIGEIYAQQQWRKLRAEQRAQDSAQNTAQARGSPGARGGRRGRRARNRT